MILMIILLSLLLVLLGGMVFCGFLLWRTNKAYDFRMEIINNIPLVNWSEAKKLYDKYSYDDMIYSIKPLKLEAWFTEEEIKILKGGSDGN